MGNTRALLLSVLLLAPRAEAAGPILAGLERLYFEPVSDPAAFQPPRGCLEELRVLMPERLSEEALSRDDQSPEETWSGCEEIAARDFVLPPPPAASLPRLVLRQVVDGSHPRITTQYWVLYQDGVRRETWFFTPVPRDDHKVLAPHLLDAARLEEGMLVLETSGSMFRPQGAWWRKRLDIHFEPGASGWRLSHVRTPAFEACGYDLGEEDPAPCTVASERVVTIDGSPWIERRSIDVERGRLEDGDGGLVELAVDALRECLGEPAARLTYRHLRAPSFDERGGAEPRPSGPAPRGTP